MNRTLFHKYIRTAYMTLLCIVLNVVLSGECISETEHEAMANPARTSMYLLPSGATNRGQQTIYQVDNGKHLAYTSYSSDSTQIALVYLHGIESHGGWFTIAADLLSKQGFDVFLLDRRGSGINRENRGFVSGHADSYQTLLQDIRYFINTLIQNYDNIYLVGLSWGGKLALAYGLTYPENIDGLVLITPGLRSLVDVSTIEKIQIVASSVLKPATQYKTPIMPEMFTTTPRYLAYIKNDPLRLKSASARFFYESNKLDGYIDRLMPDNRLPIQLYLAGGDQIIDNEGVKDVLEKGNKYELNIVSYDDQTHSIQFDAPDRLVNDIVRWITAQ